VGFHNAADLHLGGQWWRQQERDQGDDCNDWAGLRHRLHKLSIMSDVFHT
jgi:hypothetical protein